MIRWMILTVVATGLMWGAYRLLLSRDRWLQLSRVYLIAALMFSMTYPLVRLPQPAAVQGVAMLTPVLVGATEGEVADGGLPGEAGAARRLPTVVYIMGLTVATAMLVVGTARTLRRMRRMPAWRVGRLRLHRLDDDTEPCSFFNHIVIGAREMTADERRLVLAHEGEHVRRRHSWDVLLVRGMCCVVWFNPFAWLMLHDLRAVHEYQADAAATLSRTAMRPYMHLLYRQATGLGYGHITNNFQSINLKNRIDMMNKTKSRFGAWKVLAVVPLMAVLLVAGCKPAQAAGDDSVAAAAAVGNDMEVGVTDSVYTVVEVDPEFPGGYEGLYKYLAESIVYPEQAKKEGIKGRVMVRFVVEKDGTVSHAEVLRGIGGGCDEEVLRIVNAMPKWKPGRVKGEAVRVQYHLPVTFSL